MSLTAGIINIFNIFYFLIILRIFLSWIPSINWDAQPWRTVSEVTDVYLNLFRKIIPPIANIDFSPIIALIVLQIIENILLYLVQQIR